MKRIWSYGRHLSLALKDHDSDIEASSPLNFAQRSPHDVMDMQLHSASGMTMMDLGDGHTLRLSSDQIVGEGGFGTVYAARSSRFEGLIAVKMVEVSGTAQNREQLLQDIEREVAIHRRLMEGEPAVAHELLVRLHAHYTQAVRSLLLLEFCSGIELEEFVQQQRGGRLLEPAARPIATSLARALVHLHDVAGVAHLDIQPRNVLVNAQSGRIKLIDYGAAELIDKETGQVAEHGGTPNYRAPERHLVVDEQKEKQQRFLGAPADIYGLGATLFFVITGRDAFDWEATDAEAPSSSGAIDGGEAQAGGAGEDPREALIGAIRKGEVPFKLSAGSLSDPLKQLIHSMLAYEPATRPTAAQVVGHRWLTTPEGDDGEANDESSTVASPTVEKSLSRAASALDLSAGGGGAACSAA